MGKRFWPALITVGLLAGVLVLTPPTAGFAEPSTPAASAAPTGDPTTAAVVGSVDALSTRAAEIQSVVPFRLLDTRGGSSVGSGVTVGLPVLGRGGVPVSGVGSVLLNVTATNVTADSWMTVCRLVR